MALGCGQARDKRNEAIYMKHVRGLACRECGREYPVAPAHVCEFCFGPLEVVYDYEGIKASVSRASIASGPRTLWR